MASHAGLITVVKSTKGYITSEGCVTKDINKARKIYGLEFGFSNAYEVAKRLGYFDDKLKNSDYTYETVEPSYDSRLGMIEDYLQDMGYDYREACEESTYSFNSYHLEKIENFRKYIETLKRRTINYCAYRSKNNEKIIKNGKEIDIYKINRHHHELGEYALDSYYDTEERIEKYTFHLNNPHVEKYFSLNND